MGLKEIFKPAHFNKLLIILAAAVVLLFVLSLGVFVGHEKERFSQRWGENYYRNIMGPAGRAGGPGRMDFDRRGFSAHSGLGQIIKIEDNAIIVQARGDIEKTVLVTVQTVLVKNRQNIDLADLMIDDKVAVIGRPNNQGQIEARLIRVLPASSGFPARR